MRVAATALQRRHRRRVGMHFGHAMEFSTLQGGDCAGRRLLMAVCGPACGSAPYQTIFSRRLGIVSCFAWRNRLDSTCPLASWPVNNGSAMSIGRCNCEEVGVAGRECCYVLVMVVMMGRGGEWKKDVGDPQRLAAGVGFWGDGGGGDNKAPGPAGQGSLWANDCTGSWLVGLPYTNQGQPGCGPASPGNKRGRRLGWKT